MQFRHDVGCGRIFYRYIVCLFVLVDGKVVAVSHDFFFRHKKALFGAFPGSLVIRIMEAADNIGNVVFRRFASLVVKRKAVCFHVIEPHVVRAPGSGFGKHQHRRRNSRIRFEHAGGHGNHSPQLVVFYQFPANVLMGTGRAEKHPVGNNTGTASPFFQKPQKQCQKQEFRLFGVGNGFQIVVNAFCVHRSLKGRIGKTQGKAAGDFVLFGKAVFVVDFRMADGMEHQVHGGNTQHGAVGVKTGKGVSGKVFPLLRGHGVFVVLADIFGGGYQKAGCSAGRVTNGIIGSGL